MKKSVIKKSLKNVLQKNFKIRIQNRVIKILLISCQFSVSLVDVHPEGCWFESARNS